MLNSVEVFKQTSTAQNSRFWRWNSPIFRFHVSAPADDALRTGRVQLLCSRSFAAAAVLLVKVNAARGAAA